MDGLYYFLLSIMKTEKIFSGLFISGVLLKFLRIPGGNITILFSLTILSLLYLLFSFYFLRDSQTKKQKLGLSIVAGLIFFILLTGVTFKLLYWPGALAMLTSSLFFGGIYMIIILLMKNKVREELSGYINKLILRSAILYGLCFILYITPSSLLVSLEYRNDPELVRLRIAVIEDPTNKEAQYQLEKYIEENKVIVI